MLALVAVAALVLVIVFATTIWRWVEIHTGTVNESGPYYGYWSGFGSVFPWSLGIVAGIWAAYHHHACHVKGCPRLGKPVDGTPYIACPRHHPDHEGDKRGVDVSVIHRAHREAKEAA